MIRDFAKLRAAHLRLGSAGEAAAARMFRNEGCDILLRDCRMPQGEIDLIVRDGLTLVFAEVKSLRIKNPDYLKLAHPGGNLRTHQKKRIYRAALSYMRQIDNPNVPFRFDLVEMIYFRSILVEVRHWKSAFGQRSLQKKEKRINLFR